MKISAAVRGDTSLMSAVRSMARRITEVDVFILTQGILTMAGRMPTAANIDNKLALHYYATGIARAKTSSSFVVFTR